MVLRFRENLVERVKLVRKHRNRTAEFLAVFYPALGNVQVFVAVLGRFDVKKVSLAFGRQLGGVERVDWLLFL